MKPISIKLRYIFLPFILIPFIFIPVYTFLNWLLIIKTEWLTLSDTVVEFGLPLLLLAVAVILWVRPRLRLLSIKNDRVPFLYYMAAYIIFVVPTVITQKYLVTATGKMTTLPIVTEIGEVEKTKYYNIQQFHIDKKHVGIYKIAKESGKRSQNLDLSIYITCPILEKPKHTTELSTTYNYNDPLTGDQPLVVIDGVPVTPVDLPAGDMHNFLSKLNLDPKDIASVTVLKDEASLKLYGEQGKNGVIAITTKVENAIAWLGVKYTKRISNNLSQAEEEAAYRNFIEESQQEFEKTDLTKFEYLDRIGESTDLSYYKESILTSPRYAQGNPNYILVARQEPFAARNGNKFVWAFGSLFLGAGTWLLLLLIPKLNIYKTARFLKGEKLKDESWEDVKSVLKLTKNNPILPVITPTTGYVATPILLNLNLLVYLVMVVSGLGFFYFDVPDLIAWGGNFKPLIKQGEWWRLFTSTFMHGGFIHMAMNMFGLMIVGELLEPYLGKAKFALLYIITGLCGSFSSLLWGSGVTGAVSVGASGAIFGLYGVLLAFLLTKALPSEASNPIRIKVFAVVGINLAIGMAMPFIDNAAHVGGLVSGFLIGFVIGLLKEQQLLEEELITEDEENKVIN